MNNQKRYKNFEDLLQSQAEARPQRPALREGETLFTYRDLYDAVWKKKEEFRKTGKTCIGIPADTSADCVIAIFASVLAGCQTVLFDRNLPKDTLQELVTYTDTDLVYGKDGLKLTDGVKDGSGKILFFTSGTTSRSKAVVLTDESLMSSAWNGGMMLPLNEESSLLCILPLSHVFGFVCGLLWGLSCGACVSLGRGPRHYIDDCMYYRPDTVSLVPMLLEFLSKHHLFNPELKLVLVGAGDCPEKLMKEVQASGIRVSFGYGLTETSSGVAISTEGDPYAMQVCPDDTITLAEDGEVLIQAPTCMMQGYYKREEDTKAVLENGILHTGDLGRFDEEGKLHITGRKKEILVLKDGTKIYLPEYEHELTALLEIEDLAVTLKNDRPVLVCHTDKTKEELMAALKPYLKTLPRGKQLTDVILTENPLPRTASGKIRRWELEKEEQS